MGEEAIKSSQAFSRRRDHNGSPLTMGVGTSRCPTLGLRGNGRKRNRPVDTFPPSLGPTSPDPGFLGQRNLFEILQLLQVHAPRPLLGSSHTQYLAGITTHLDVGVGGDEQT